MDEARLRQKVNSFSQLRHFLSYVRQLSNSTQDEAQRGFFESSFARFIVGLHAIGESDLSQFESFVANRYFLDACHLPSFPPKRELLEWLASQQDALRAAIHALIANPPQGQAGLQSLVGELVASWRQSASVEGVGPRYEASAREGFQRNGYSIIPAVFSKEECEEARSLILSLAEKEHANQSAYYYGHTNTLQRVYNIITKGPIFGELLAKPIVNDIMQDIFDRPTLHEKYYLSSYHANIIPPNGPAQKLHVDAYVPEPLPPWIIRANMNFILQDYTFTNGATLCVPGSHRWCRKPGPQDQAVISERLTPLEASAGSIVVWHGHLWHQSGHNQTDQCRVALLPCFAATFMLEMALEENHFRLMSEEFARSLPGDLYQMLGWEHGMKSGASQVG